MQLALVDFFLPPTGAHTPLALEQLALCGIIVAGAFRNGKLCRITKFSQDVVKNGR